MFFIQFESIYAEASALADLDAWTSWSRQPGATSRQTELYVTVDEQDYMCKLNLDTVE